MQWQRCQDNTASKGAGPHASCSQRERAAGLPGAALRVRGEMETNTLEAPRACFDLTALRCR